VESSGNEEILGENVSKQGRIDAIDAIDADEEITLVSNQDEPKRKDTQVPQPSDPIEYVQDEAVHKELGDNLVRAATTIFSLEAE
nr:hypothetical protein [Tanacetum cinerariifolium]